MGNYIETKRGNLPGNGAQALHPSAQETEFQESQGYTQKPCVQKTKGCGRGLDEGS